MRRYTYTKINIFSKILFIVSIFFVNSIYSQVQQNGIMHVEDNTIFYVSPGETTVNFGSSSTTTTTRTTNTYGKIQFANGLTINSPDPAKVNGYVSSLSSSTFFAPTGSSTLRRVINFSEITNNTNGIDVAYYEVDPNTIGTSLTTPVESITTLEYFHIKNTGASAKIEYSWEASNNIAGLTNNKVKNVALVGYNGTSWVEIPSTLVGNLTNGSVTSSSAILLSDYEYYTLGVITGHIASLNCTPTLAGTLVNGASASGVSAEFSYTGGNGRSFVGQAVNSTGVTGLTATLADGDFTTSTGSITYNITGTPSSTGTATFDISLDGKNCSFNMTVIAASIASISCGTAVNMGVLTSGTPASGVTSELSYTGGNGGLHSGQIVNSTGVLGLTATLTSGNFASGAGTLTYTITGTTFDSGNAFFAINIGGRTCTLTRFVECRILIPSSGNMKTWNGSAWTPSSPTIVDPVTIDAAYANGSFRCNSIILNADLTLSDNQTLEVEGGITTSTGRKIIMSSSANLVQRDASGTAPTIQLTKQTRSLRRNDYTYFGTPISGNFLSQMATAKSETGILTRALDGFYRWQTGDSAGWQNLTMTETGKGFIAKVTNQAPFSNLTVLEKISYILNGTANNGNISVPITKSTNVDANFFGNFNLLANPYPSAIYADKFLEDNNNIDGVVYIWVASRQEGTGVNYVQDDYISYTKMGTTVPGGVIQNTFSGQIASGQGFMVKALFAGDVDFNNCMRLSEGTPNNSFFKTSSPKSVTKIDRFKLNLTNDTGVFSQILIGYLPNCTLNYDRMYDASRNSVSSTQLFSHLDDGQQLAINARPSFTKDDVVPIGIYKSSTAIESFRISIIEKEGIFEDPSVNVFLHDKFLNAYHNFKNGDYIFTTNSTFLASRFTVVYDNATLSNSTFDENNLVGYIKEGMLQISCRKSIASLEIFDISGKSIEKIKANNTNKIIRPFNNSESIYIVKVNFTDGKLSSLKLTNEK